MYRRVLLPPLSWGASKFLLSIGKTENVARKKIQFSLCFPRADTSLAVLNLNTWINQGIFKFLKKEPSALMSPLTPVIWTARDDVCSRQPCNHPFAAWKGGARTPRPPALDPEGL